MRVRLLGVPMDLGSARRGTDMGPSAIRAAGLEAKLEALGHEVTDAGNVFSHEPETRKVRDEGARFAHEIARTCQTLARRVEDAVSKERFPLILGGDHAIAIGTGAGVHAAGHEIGLLWIDAHSDFNTPETSPSGNVHGMPVSALTGRGDALLVGIGEAAAKVKEENIAMVGVRSVDRKERQAIEDAGITVFTMRDIDELGMRGVMTQALEIVTDGTDWLHVSLDMDVVDPEHAPGVGTPVKGGTTYRETHLAMEMIADTEAMGSMEIVEVNPILDEHNKTAELAVELAQSAFGKAIL